MMLGSNPNRVSNSCVKIRQSTAPCNISARRQCPGLNFSVQLCVAVVNKFARKITTEAQSTLRLHREELIRSLRAQLSLRNSLCYKFRLRGRPASAAPTITSSAETHGSSFYERQTAICRHNFHAHLPPF